MIFHTAVKALKVKTMIYDGEYKTYQPTNTKGKVGELLMSIVANFCGCGC